MKITEILKYNHSTKRPCFSFEFFPPKTEEGKINLDHRISRMIELGPSFAAVTWGTGNSTSTKSLELCNTIQNDLGLDTLMHITATNTDTDSIIECLEKAKTLGVENILALRGDQPIKGLNNDLNGGKQLKEAIELIQLIRNKFGNHFCIGTSAYPESHPESRGLEADLKHLKDKVDAGADFILTQFFFSAEKYYKWLKSVREFGITVPVIPSSMILQSYASFRRLISLTGIKVPKEITEKLEKVKHDDKLFKEIGVEMAVELVKELCDYFPSKDSDELPCVHFFTLNLEKSVHEVLIKLNWVKPISPTFKIGGIEKRHLLHIQEEWDNYPNGRFGSSFSPAYGNLEGYRNGLKVEPNKAISLWGSPNNLDELASLFVKFLQGELPQLPWCEAGDLDPESELIKSHLIELNRKHCFTLSSQPPLDAIPSSHPVYGWGPKDGGFVFQKAYIELLVHKSKLTKFLAKLNVLDPELTYMAVDSKGEFLTNNMEACTVTWGVFPQGEIAQATLIEPTSFKAWGDEVFQITQDWMQLFDKGSSTYLTLNEFKDNFYLVNIVDHQYKQNDSQFFKGVVNSV